ncbi:MAG: hypothetical protein ABI439_14715 [Rhodospirillales bacterium]
MSDTDLSGEKTPQWLWLLAGGLGSLLLVGGVVGWILRGPALLIDMADFFCL